MIFITIFLTADAKDVPMQELSQQRGSGYSWDAITRRIQGKGLRKLKTVQKKGGITMSKVETEIPDTGYTLEQIKDMAFLYREKCQEVSRLRAELRELKERDEEKVPSMKINDEAVKIGAITFRKGTKVYRCPSCKRLMIYGDRFCRDCGQRIKWEDWHESI